MIHSRWFSPYVAMSLALASAGCHHDTTPQANASAPEKMETRIVGAVRAPTKEGKTVTAGVRMTIVSERRAPPSEAVIRAVLVAAQALIRDSVISPVTLSSAAAAGRDIPILTRYATLANPVPSYSVSRAHYTWVTSGDGVMLTNDQCVDRRQRFIAMPHAPGTYVCAPTTLGWRSQPSE